MTEVAVAAPPEPGSEEWLKLITASKISAICGVSPWDSPLSLWLKMAGVFVEEDDESDVKERGNLLEEGVLQWFLGKHPEYVNVDRQFYATVDGIPWGAATCDARVDNGMTGKFGYEDLVEVKTAVKIFEWGKPGTDQVPLYYRVQGLWQLLMRPQAKRVFFAVLGPYLDFREYVIHRTEVGQELDDLLEIVTAFRQSLEDGNPPEPDGHAATFKAIKLANSEVEKGESAQVDVELAREYLLAVEAADLAEERAREAKSRLLGVMGKAQYAVVGKHKVARRQNNRHGISLVKTSSEPDLIRALAEALIADVTKVTTD